MKRLPQSRLRAGYTLVEIIVVISVIASLAGIGIPVYGVIVGGMKRTSTRSLVVLVAQQIESYGVKRWTWTDPTLVSPMNNGRPVMYSGNMFALKVAGQSLNGSGETIPFPTIDGWPMPNNAAERSASAQYDGPFINQTTLVNSGYMGFYDMVGAPIDRHNVNAKHQIIDAWGEPLRIVYAANVYGTRGFGVWSPGPDKVDQDLNPLSPRDDLRSWEGIDDPISTGKR